MITELCRQDFVLYNEKSITHYFKFSDTLFVQWWRLFDALRVDHDNFELSSFEYYRWRESRMMIHYESSANDYNIVFES